MSISAKIYNKLILNRIYDEVNEKLKMNQAGFRRNMSCGGEQISPPLRRITENGMRLKHPLPLITTFIDFEKAGDSIKSNPDVMWKILRFYGIPIKIITRSI